MVGTSVYRRNTLIAHDKAANVTTFLLNEFLNIKNGVVITAQQRLVLQNGLSKIGVKSKIVSEPWSVASKKMRDEQQMYDLLWLWRSTYYADPNNWIGEMYACDQVGARNNSWYCDPEVDKLLMEARVEPDQAKRAANYKKAAKMVTDDAGGIFVYNTKWFGPYNKKVKGVRFSPIGNAQEMRWVHME